MIRKYTEKSVRTACESVVCKDGQVSIVVFAKFGGPNFVPLESSRSKYAVLALALNQKNLRADRAYMIVIMGSIMKSDAFNYASEFERLRELEFGEPFEPGIRLSAIALAGVLIFLSTGWIIALIWAGYFLLSFWAHAHFITSRKSFVARYEVVGVMPESW